MLFWSNKKRNDFHAFLASEIPAIITIVTLPAVLVSLLPGYWLIVSLVSSISLAFYFFEKSKDFVDHPTVGSWGIKFTALIILLWVFQNVIFVTILIEKGFF